ncbi:unnamed protein product [Adineta ricciae]|uniref:Cilia- and flagella-associated protein 91 n=2 Tax=Adineta ricciae TaxID=249248 RepID=A0A815GME6_ADIRI|nr:unnamed protein product [Adineta ricciae]
MLDTNHVPSCFNNSNQVILSCSSPLYQRSDFSCYQRKKYADVPNLSRTSDKTRSIFMINDYYKNSDFPKDSKLLSTKELIKSFRHVCLQTDYREESSQTDPYSPAYTVSHGEHPEVFDLSDFIYGKGLPATLLEISFIERLRARRQWEQDRTFDVTRMQIVIEREIREWQMREKEIKLLQDKRQKLFEKNLETYIRNDEELTQNFVDLFVYREEKQLKQKHQRLEIQTSRDIRRMKRWYQLRETHINSLTSYNHLGAVGLIKCDNNCYISLKPPWHTRSNDMITNLKSNIWCPQFDHFIDRRMRQIGMNVLQFEDFLPKNAFTTKINQKSLLTASKNRRLQRRIENLDKAYQLIQQGKSNQSSLSEQRPLRFVEKIESVAHFQQLHSTSLSIEEQDHRRLALIKFQNYLRTITTQSKIANVQHIRKDLLEELRNPHRRISSIDLNKDDIETQIYDYVESATIGDMLDFLSKELLRLQWEQTIHLFIILADRQRYEREKQETNIRRQTIQRQKLENEIFQQVFSLSSDIDIETYVRDLILQSISDTADEQARLDIQRLTENLIELTTNPSCTQLDAEGFISNLVYQFLLPAVCKHLQRQKKTCS